MPSTRTPLPRNLLDTMHLAGFDVPALAREAGVDALDLETGLTHGEADRFISLAWTRVGDPSFGLKAGRVVRTERLGVPGLAAMTSPDVATAFKVKARYNRLVWGDDYEVVERADRFTVVVAGRDEDRPYGAAKIDMELSSLVAFASHFTGKAIVPMAVELRQAAPSYGRLYRQILGVEPNYERVANSISFRAEDAALRLISANAQAHAGLVEAAESMLARLDDFGLSARVRVEVDRVLGVGDASLAAIAHRLHLSERTLQRRLASEGFHFGTLLDTARRELAERKLRNAQASTPELAFLLGFANSNSFHRAFKRWTGTTPEAFRQQAQGGARGLESPEALGLGAVQQGARIRGRRGRRHAVTQGPG